MAAPPFPPTDRPAWRLRRGWTLLAAIAFLVIVGAYDGVAYVFWVLGP